MHHVTSLPPIRQIINWKPNLMWSGTVHNVKTGRIEKGHSGFYAVRPMACMMMDLLCMIRTVRSM